MTTKRVTIAYEDDWSGLYIDGLLVYENHSVNARDVLTHLGIPHNFVEVQIDGDIGLPEAESDLVHYNWREGEGP